MADLNEPMAILGCWPEFVTRADGGKRSIVLVETTSGLFAYLNSCPHLGSTLDTIQGRFTDHSGRWLLCATHGARFHPETGKCVFGPCVGRHLIPISVGMEGGRWVIYEDPETLPASAV